jgi:transketolase
MGAVVNGMALHGGVIPVGGTFLIFSDYMKPSIRLASLMGVPSIFVFSHDSIALGEDGPTHQPVEQLVSLRSIPGLVVLRPGDANETRAAWVHAVRRRTGPTAIVLTRQDLPTYTSPSFGNADIAKGAYVVSETPNKNLDLILVATGSEVHLSLIAQKELEKSGKAVRVVSMPSWELFEAQSKDYRDKVLPGRVKTLAVEAASPMGWERYADAGVFMTRFGASAPGDLLLDKFGFNVKNVVQKAMEL